MLARIGFGPLILVWTFLRFQAHAADIPSLVQKAKPVVVQVIASDANWTPVRTGTGFFISSDGDLLTNFHVIQGAVHISARTDKGAMFVFERVLAESTHSDVALLKFQATDVDFLKIGTSTNAVVGETVLVIGNPEGLQGTVSNGIISAFRENRAYIQITAPVSPGSSGSPVLDETGQVIGMATLVSKEGQNLNFAISAEVIEAVLQSGSMQASSQAHDAELASGYYSKALRESQSHDYEGAIRDYSEAIRLKPDFADAYIHRAEARLSMPIVSRKDREEQCSEAVVDYTEAIRLRPDNTDLFFYRGLLYNELQRSQDAIADFSQVIQLDPKLVAAYLWRGVARANMGRYTEAIADCSEAIKRKPDYADAYFERGDIFERFGQYRQAVADYTEAIRLKPDIRLFYFKRGNAYDALKQYENSISDYSKVIRRWHNDADAYRDRGEAYKALGDTKRADADFKKAQQLALRKD